MSLAFTSLVQGIQLPSSVGVLYTCPAGQATLVKHAVLVNTTAGGVTATMYVIPSGGTVVDACKVLDANSINAHTAYVSAELAGVVLNAGDTIQGLAGSGSSISVNISGVKQN